MGEKIWIRVCDLCRHMYLKIDTSTYELVEGDCPCIRFAFPKPKATPKLSPEEQRFLDWQAAAWRAEEERQRIEIANRKPWRESLTFTHALRCLDDSAHSIMCDSLNGFSLGRCAERLFELEFTPRILCQQTINCRRAKALRKMRCYLREHGIRPDF